MRPTGLAPEGRTAAPLPAVFSVAELDRRLKRAVEGASTDVWVEGEVSGAKWAPSGHVYFCLKDEREEAVIDCVLYRSASPRAHRLVADGARLQLRGKATVWAPRGRLQFIADQARPAGRGALLEALEKLKEKLLAEGLFAPERKRKLPSEPRLVGVVTSASGAAIHDIAKVAFRRGGARILLSPTLVQGPTAAARLIWALDRLESIEGLDVIIVGRGGGSADDLMVFNDEQVVRRVAACRVPVVSAVGHEVDTTLTDLAADVRAATPSQAAELVVADANSRRDALRTLAIRLRRAMHGRLSEDQGVLRDLRYRMVPMRLVLVERQQQIDEADARMRYALDRLLGRRRGELERLHRRLAARHPRAVLSRSVAALGPLKIRLIRAANRCVDRGRSELGSRAAQLEALSPLSVLARGYAIATDRHGRALRSTSEVRAGDTVRVRLHEGSFSAIAQDPDPSLENP